MITAKLIIFGFVISLLLILVAVLLTILLFKKWIARKTKRDLDVTNNQMEVKKFFLKGIELDYSDDEMISMLEKKNWKKARINRAKEILEELHDKIRTEVENVQEEEKNREEGREGRIAYGRPITQETRSKGSNGYTTNATSPANTNTATTELPATYPTDPTTYPKPAATYPAANIPPATASYATTGSRTGTGARDGMGRVRYGRTRAIPTRERRNDPYEKAQYSRGSEGVQAKTTKPSTINIGKPTQAQPGKRKRIEYFD